ncbi:hypothetical protein [Streptomyces luteoverticillatus]|uniref:hypothetical protein n=1 Tax=Streptomyces luteoverticillatus TaxID=66425 RepID=UPI0013DF3D4E|nr:hypothetical protein [Streptomyces luteoverticillatus]
MGRLVVRAVLVPVVRPGRAPGEHQAPVPEARVRVVPVVRQGHPAPGERARAAREPEARPVPGVPPVRAARAPEERQAPVARVRVVPVREPVAPVPEGRGPVGPEQAGPACGSAATPPRPRSREVPAR